MDAIDFQIVRQFYSGGQGRFWISRSIVDPRITPREIARHVHLSEVAVRTRIRKLGEAGVIVGDEVWPNPAAFGVGVERAELPLAAGQDIAPLFRALSEVDGVLSARRIVLDGRPALWVAYVRDARNSTARRVEGIRRRAEGRRLRLMGSVWYPPVRGPLSPESWRVIAALRSDPERGLRAQARRAGVSSKTFTRHFHRLIDNGAIFWTRRFNSRLIPAIALEIYPRTRADRRPVYEELDRLGGPWMPFAQGGLGERVTPRPRWIGGLFWAPTPVASFEIAARVRQLPGVGRVKQLLFTEAETFPGWFDRQLARRLLPRANS